jgi:hypothetical protein
MKFRRMYVTPESSLPPVTIHIHKTGSGGGREKLAKGRAVLGHFGT